MSSIELTPSGPLAVIYGAKSTKDPHESIPTQLADARRAAEAAGYTVVGTYFDEAASAYSGNRGQGLTNAKDHALRLAAEHGAAALWVQHSDRLARGDGISADHLAEVWFALRRHGVALRSAQDDHNLEDALRVVLIGERNHEDSKRKADAVKAGMDRRRARGLHNGGPEKYGYKYERDAYGRTVPDHPLALHPVEAEVIKRIAADLLAGVSQKQLARDLNAEGLHTKRGGEWYQGIISKIVRDPFYAGLVEAPDGTLEPGQHPAILDRDTWERVRATSAAARKSKTSAGGRQPTREVLFTNRHLICGTCGGPMGYRYKARMMPGERLYEYEAYVCRARERDVSRCTQPPLNRAAVEGAVLYALRERGGQVIDRAQQIVDGLDADRRVTTAQRAEAEVALATVGTQLERIETDYLAGDLSVRRYEPLLERLEAAHEAAAAELAQLTAREAELVERLESADVQGAALTAMAELRGAIATALADARGIERVRATLRRIFPTITVRQVGDSFHLDPGEPGEDWLAELLPGGDPTGELVGLPMRSVVGPIPLEL